jgi:hypothetical protein
MLGGSPDNSTEAFVEKDQEPPQPGQPFAGHCKYESAALASPFSSSQVEWKRIVPNKRCPDRKCLSQTDASSYSEFL